MTVVLGKILSVFLIIAVGFGANRLGVLPSEANKYMSNILMFITSPCLILSSITAKELTRETAVATVELIIGSCLWFVVFTLIGYYLCTRLLKVQPASDTGVFIFLFASLSNGFMGIPITMVLFDSDVLYLMILHSTVLAIYLYAAGLPLVHIGTEKNRGFSRETLLIIFKNPATICAAAAIVMLFTGLKLPSVVFDSVEMVGGFTTPLSMLIVGIQLGDSNLKRIVKNKTLLTLSVIKMAALPVLTFFYGKLASYRGKYQGLPYLWGCFSCSSGYGSRHRGGRRERSRCRRGSRTYHHYFFCNDTADGYGAHNILRTLIFCKLILV